MTSDSCVHWLASHLLAGWDGVGSWFCSHGGAGHRGRHREGRRPPWLLQSDSWCPRSAQHPKFCLEPCSQNYSHLQPPLCPERLLLKAVSPSGVWSTGYITLLPGQSCFREGIADSSRLCAWAKLGRSHTLPNPGTHSAGTKPSTFSGQRPKISCWKQRIDLPSPGPLYNPASTSKLQRLPKPLGILQVWLRPAAAGGGGWFQAWPAVLGALQGGPDSLGQLGSCPPLTMFGQTASHDPQSPYL